MNQEELELKYNKNQLIPRIKREFYDSEIDFEAHMIENNIDPKFGFSLLAHMVIHKRADVPTLVGLLNIGESKQDVADMLYKCVEADLVDYHTEYRIFIVKFNIDPLVQKEIDTYQFPLPMIIKPNKVRTNTEIGYLTFKKSIILKDNHHDNDVCLDHINRVNRIRFKLNMDTVKTVQNKWRHLDKRKPLESAQEYQARLKAFDKYDKSSREVINILNQEGNNFYLTHRYDKRGRVYPMGYHVNYAGNDWSKAIIEFKNSEVIV